MIGFALRAMLVLCFVSSLVACYGGPPNRPHQGHTNLTPQRTSATVTAPEGNAARGVEASEPAERTVVERTVGDFILRQDALALRIDEAKLLRSHEGDEIFVRATTNGPVQHRGCFLMEGATWLALQEAIESSDLSEVPVAPEASWAGPLTTERFSSGDTYAVFFREDHERNDRTIDPRDTPFFALCYKDAGADTTTWYDVAHVEGTPKDS